MYQVSEKKLDDLLAAIDRLMQRPDIRLYRQFIYADSDAVSIINLTREIKDDLKRIQSSPGGA